jgi:hypothetical protein
LDRTTTAIVSSGAQEGTGGSFEVPELDAIDYGVLLRNRKQRIVYSNSAARRLLDWPTSLPLLGRKTVRRRGFQIHRLDDVPARKPIARVFATGATINGGRFLLRYSTGKTRLVNCSWVPVFDPEQTVSYVLTTIVDIHDTELTRELREWLIQEAFQVISGASLLLENHLRNHPDDEAGNITYAVEALRRLARGVRGRCRQIDGAGSFVRTESSLILRERLQKRVSETLSETSRITGHG